MNPPLVHAKYKRRAAAHNVDPLVRQLFDHINALGVTYRSVERAAGLARNHMCKWKTGRANPTFSNLQAVCGALGLKLMVVPENINT